MTKILNSLKVTGTGSSSQALGVTGGYVSINDKLRIGDWSIPTATVNINSPGTTSSTNATYRNKPLSTDVFTNRHKLRTHSLSKTHGLPLSITCPLPNLPALPK
jgi:hypothetical protein